MSPVIRTFLVSLLLASMAPEPAMPEPANQPPSVTLSNSLLTVLVYLPDVDTGYYRGPRFEWGGIVGQVTLAGHTFLGPLRPRHDPLLHDHVTGLADEFDLHTAVGYDEARPGDPFVKIGVGTLRRPDAKPYRFSRTYEILTTPRWTLTRSSAAIILEQSLDGPRGWGYRYTKRIALTPDRPELTLDHTLVNTGNRPIDTEHYNHNMLRLDDRPVGAGYRLTFPFPVTLATDTPARVTRNLVELTEPVLSRILSSPVTGPGRTGTNTVLVSHADTGSGVSITTDRSFSRFELYGESTALCPEPFIRLRLTPGGSTSWTTRYRFSIMP